MVEHHDRVARLVIRRAPMDHADAEVVLAHVNHAKLPVGRTRRGVLQNQVNVGLGNVEGNVGRRTSLRERDRLPHGGCEQTKEDAQNDSLHSLPPPAEFHSLTVEMCTVIHEETQAETGKLESKKQGTYFVLSSFPVSRLHTPPPCIVDEQRQQAPALCGFGGTAPGTAVAQLVVNTLS